MNTVSSVALSRLVAQQRVMDVIAGNIANANTPGFKAGRVQFSDWLIREAVATHRQGIGPSRTPRTARPGANSARGH